MKMRLLILVALGFSLVPSCFSTEILSEKNPMADQLKGMSCQIHEESAVTHVRAHTHGQDELGAIACLGYLHGRDRAWQMDFLRRIVEGRKSEILGYRSLQDDLEMRLLGLHDKAVDLYNQMSEPQRAPFWAYAYGVNQGFQTERASNSYEFRHYDYQPEEWTPINSLEVLLLQSFDQTKQTFTRKIDEAGWLAHYGAQAPLLFSNFGLPWTTTILKAGEYLVGTPLMPTPGPAHSEDHAFFQQSSTPQFNVNPFPTGDIGLGSNNWAIAPSRSLTGHAFFANDPHLDMVHPPFWYWAHIEGGKIDVIGASLPGVPAIISGSNRHVAWGLTNSYFDVSELDYVPSTELFGNKDDIWPLVWVKIGAFKLPFFFRVFQRTKQGWPILPIPGGPSQDQLVLRWSGYDITPNDLSGLFEVMVAGSVQDADRAFSHIGVPSWNFTFADTSGGIGYRTVGKLPKRLRNLPFGIPTAHFSELKPWTYLSADEAPHVLNPSRGYVVTANNQQWPADSLFRSGRDHATSLRAFRIEEMLNQIPRHDRSTIQRMQCDQQAVDARFILPELLKAFQAEADTQGGLNEREAGVFQTLRSWDYVADESCRACGMWERWTDRLYAADHLTPPSLYRLAKADTDENFKKSLLTTYRAAMNDLKVGPHGEMRPWGEIHKNPFTHLSGDPAFAVPPIPTGGDEFSVNPGTATWDPKLGEYLQNTGASQRLIVEMSDPPAVYSVLAGSNQDIEKPNLTDPDGPWMKWKNCQLEHRDFPLDWSSVPSQEVVFH